MKENLIKTVNGKKQNRDFQPKKEAGMAALAEYNGGGYVKPKEIVVADFLDLWIEEYVKINLRHKIRTLFFVRTVILYKNKWHFSCNIPS